jgi:hypothetical protein
MSLDNRIVMLLENYPNRALHWWEIRNELVMELNINNVESLSVKLSRALKRLLREGIVEKHDSSHRSMLEQSVGWCNPLFLASMSLVIPTKKLSEKLGDNGLNILRGMRSLS